jgi:alpha-beta hydrolase superfamily lysophospholipase
LRGLRLFAAAVLVFLGAAASAVLWHVGTTLAQPPRKTVAAPSDLPVGPFVLDRGGVSLRGWVIEAAERRGTVILLHGLGDSRLSMLDRARFLLRAGYSSLLYDSRAHGESSGEWVTFGALESEDLRRVLRWRREQHPGERIAVIGTSLGGASAVVADPPLEVDALVIEAVYASIEEATADRLELHLERWARVFEPLLTLQLAWRLDVSREQLRPVERIAAIRAPKLIVAGEADRHTPLAATERLHAAAAAPKELWLLPEVAHDDLHWAAGDEYERRILDFLERHLRSGGG